MPTVATNLTGLYAQPSFSAEMLTQVTNGTPLDVLAAKDLWCHVRQADGYEGWAYARYLSNDPAPTPTHLIGAGGEHLCAAGR